MTDQKKTLPGHETQPTEVNCPSCGRFVGAVNKCPYCGAKVEKRLSLVATRWAAILLATIGLFLLWLMAINRQVPVVALGNVQPTMNFGQIRVEGTVRSDAKLFRTGLGMSFHVDDGTGSIIVFITKKQMDEMNELNLVPKAGDTISFIGSLSISEDQQSMRLLSLKDMTLTRSAADELRLADLSPAMKGNAVIVAGKVTKLEAPAEGTKRPYALHLQDDSGEQIINFWQSEYDQIDRADSLEGAYVRMRVAVGVYQKNMQIKLASGKDLEILDAPPAPPAKAKPPAQKAAETYRKKDTPPPRDFSRGRDADAPALAPGDVTADLKGHTVRVRGFVSSVSPPKPGTKQPFSLLLRDGGQSLRVSYWSNVDDVIADKPAPGALFEIEGVVDVYRDRPQLMVESGYKVRQIQAPTAPPEKAAAGSIGELSSADAGKSFTVLGTLGAPRDLAGKGTAYTLSDDTGSLDLILWNTSVPESVRDTLAEGRQVRASGILGEYEGKLQLKAGGAQSVRVQD